MQRQDGRQWMPSVGSVAGVEGERVRRVRKSRQREFQKATGEGKDAQRLGKHQRLLEVGTTSQVGSARG